MERKKVLDTVNISLDFLLTSLEKASKLLLEKKEELEKEGWTSLHLKMDWGYDHSELIIKGMRFETDGEYNKRLKVAQKKEEKLRKKEEREKQQYLKLKEKYENYD